jgi:triphosphoribosyl-dephospho-CoA synthase
MRGIQRLAAGTGRIPLSTREPTKNETRLLQQGGLAALKTAQAEAASILKAGGVATPEGWRLFQHLDRDLVALKSSPRGSADLLAATVFIDNVSKRPATQK